jgi:hypothetical protein
MVVCAAGMTITAQAAVGLFSTGVDNSGNTLALGTVDPHYSLAGGGPAYAVQQAQSYPGYWVQPDLTSEWITPLLGSDNTGSGVTGTYVFQTTFDLTGIDLTTARIQGQISADNAVSAILINGSSIGYSQSGVLNYGSWASFTVGSGLHSGINTLTFDVYNESGPSGLRVNFNGTGSVLNPVPEPETYAMMLAGLGMMGFIARRRKAV